MAKEDKEKIVVIKEGAKKDKKKGFVISIAPDEIPNGVKKEDIIAGYIVKNNEKEEKEKKTLNPKLFLIGAVILPLFVCLGSCSNRTEHINTPFEVTYYEMVSPQTYAFSSVGQEGQEEITNNVIEEGNSLEGSFYSAKEHAQKEDKSIEGHSEFKQDNSLIDEYMKILKDENSTSEQIEQAIRNIYVISQNVKDMYSEKEVLINNSLDNFEENARLNPDKRTSGEIEVANEIKKEYYKDFGLSAENVRVISDLVKRLDAGEEIKIDEVKQDLAGNYSISGESCKEVVKESIFTRIKNSMSKFFSGINNEQTRDYENEK